MAHRLVKLAEHITACGRVAGPGGVLELLGTETAPEEVVFNLRAIKIPETIERLGELDNSPGYNLSAVVSGSRRPAEQRDALLLAQLQVSKLCGKGGGGSTLLTPNDRL